MIVPAFDIFDDDLTRKLQPIQEPYACSGCGKMIQPDDEYCEVCIVRIQTAPRAHCMLASEREREARWLIYNSDAFPRDIVIKRLSELTGNKVSKSDLILRETLISQAKNNKP